MSRSPRDVDSFDGSRLRIDDSFYLDKHVTSVEGVQTKVFK
ncbi:hypothetical protein M0802_016666 [Mischocyttarus mexicanus]|nr:hypothetical protein M0802_016666 [Mischocyttarus mexicanus]